MASRILLGHVRLPSRTVVVVDAGLLHLWCHADFAHPERWHLSGDTRDRAENSVDLRIEGPDAEAAAQALDRQWHPRWLFDIPQQAVAEAQRQFTNCLTTRGLQAQMVVHDRRVAHRERVDLALEHGGEQGEIQFHGIWAAVCTGFDPAREYPVHADPMPDGPDQARWRRIAIDLGDPDTVVSVTKVGSSMVDEARLMFADADALGQWVHDDALDSKADVVFWGADAERIARLRGAQLVDDGTYGWLNLRLELAELKLEELSAAQAEQGLKLAIDARPHSHHWQLMEQIRRNATGAGTVAIGDALLCGFSTTWGDGIFDVLAARDAAGHLVQLIIDCGNEATVARQRQFEEWWFGTYAKSAFVTCRVLEEGARVGYLHRDEPVSAGDSGWRCFAGDESKAYVDADANWRCVPLRELFTRDRSLDAVLRAPHGAAFRRKADGCFEVVGGTAGS